MEEVGSWYKRVLSWNPMRNSTVVRVEDEELALQHNVRDSTDSNDLRPNMRLQRKPAIRRLYRRKISQAKRETVVDIDETPSFIRHSFPVDSIFDLYHLWKNDCIEKEMEALPENSRAILEASWKGHYDNLEILLHNSNSNHLIDIISDSKGRSGLHYACSFGHLQVVEFFLERCANPNILDLSGCITPLICAAVNGNEQIMDLLLANGADINLGLEMFESLKHKKSDTIREESHTALLWAVRAEKMSSVKYLLNKGAKLTGTAINWETPLHESAYFGFYKILKILIRHDQSSVELRGGKIRNTALHTSVQEGHIKCIKALLAADANPNAVNSLGITPIHIAASTADLAAMELLIAAKADVDVQEIRFRTALHYLVVNFQEYDTVDCMELLLRNDADMNIQDELGYTPLCLAVVYECSPLVVVLLRSGADLSVRIKSGQSGLEILVKKMPHTIKYVKDSLDLAITLKNKDLADPDCTLAFDFRAIVTTAERKVPNILKFYKETEFLFSLCKTGHKYILSHPVIEAFLILKWRKVRKYFWASFAFNIFMVITYSWFLVAVYSVKCPISVANNGKVCENAQDTNDWIFLSTVWSKTLLIIFTSVFSLKEILQMAFYPISYIKMFENYVQLLLIVTIVVTIFPVLRSFDGFCSRLTDWEYTFAAVGIVVAWFSILLKIGKMPRLGLYVQMLLNVVRNFGIFTCAYASILIAFSLSFAILFKNKSEFSNIFNALQSVIVMMTGEIEIKHILNEEIYVNASSYNSLNENGPLHVVTNVIFASFILLVTIVLMNLLVGLAVSDIQGLLKGAKVSRLSRLVVAISQLESMLFSKGLIIILPNKWKHELQRSALVVPKDNQYTFNFRPYDPRDTRLPQSLQIDALSILEELEKQKDPNARKNSAKCECHVNHEQETRQDIYEKIQNIENSLNSFSSTINDIQTMLKFQIDAINHK